MAKQPKNKNGFEEPRINDEIRGYDEVRVVYKQHHEMESEGDFTKVMSLREARRTAENLGLDLIEINNRATPPILRIANYSKYLYERKKALKNKGKQKTETKEVQLSVNISEHDLEVKAKKAAEFINDGDKVKVVLRMRGRELSRREQSKTSLFQFVDLLSDIAVAESMPKDEGNKCIVYLKKKK